MSGYCLGLAVRASVCSTPWGSLLFLTKLIICLLSWYSSLFICNDWVNVADGPEFRCTGDAFTLSYPHGLKRVWGMFTLRLRGHLLDILGLFVTFQG
ncbi:unnamed protein product [Cochlearia groenlandica]